MTTSDTSAPTEGEMPVATDTDARFARLFENELAYVCRTLARLGVDSRDIEDVAQEVFMTVHARMADVDLSRPVRPWLFTFAYHAAQNYRRLARHRGSSLADEDLFVASGASDPARQAEARSSVLGALATIPLERRAVLVMYELDDVGVDEIAKCLEIPVNTVYSRLRIAREEFATAVRQDERGVT